MKRIEMLARSNFFKRPLLWFLAMSTLNAAAKTSVTREPFGYMPDGTPIEVYTLNDQNIQVRIITYGGILVSLRTPDRSEKKDDIVLGFDSLDNYVAKSTFFGALVGRYANRIAKGNFTLEGVTYSLPVNDSHNTLHGGRGFDKVVWKAKPIANGVALDHMSPDGDQGFPGNLAVTVRYTLVGNTLRIEYAATTDKPTVVNLTNHSYFNLAGQGNGDILKQVMQINASHYTPADSTLIPTGEIASVEGTPFDFRTPHRIGERIDQDNEQLRRANGYDQNWVLDNKSGKLAVAAIAYDPGNGRTLEVSTTEPGVQFYTSNHMQGSIPGKQGKTYGFRSAFCLETEHFPDSPNHPTFPSTELKPGRRYDSITVFKFGARPN
jgi:aldose 1-epimerase